VLVQFQLFENLKLNEKIPYDYLYKECERSEQKTFIICFFPTRTNQFLISSKGLKNVL